MKPLHMAFIAPLFPLLLTGCNSSLNSLTGYTASMLCSKTFITGLDRETIFEEDLIPITQGSVKLTKTEINYAEKSVTSSAFNVSNTALFRQGIGCTLVGQQSKDALLNQIPEPTLVLQPDAEEYWPKGAAGINPVEALESVAMDALMGRHFSEFKSYQVKTHSVAIVHQGRLVYERYASDYTQDTPIYGFSVAKTVAALYSGILHDQGLLNLDSTGVLPFWHGNATDQRHDITARHLLTMTSGLDFDESLDAPESDANMLFVDENMAEFSANQPLKYAPGSGFYYSTGDTMVLSALLTELSGGSLKDVHEKLTVDLFEKLNVSNSMIQADTSGNLVFGMQGLFGTHDMARIGLLLMSNGEWGGEQIISEEWLEIMKTPVMHSNPLGYSYGAGIWLNLDVHGNKFLPDLPEDTLIAFGLRGQFIIASPSLELVIVRTGSTMDAYDFIADMNDFSAEIAEIVVH